MDVKNTQQNINVNTTVILSKTNSSVQNNSEKVFADELQNAQKNKETITPETDKTVESDKNNETDKTTEKKEQDKIEQKEIDLKVQTDEKTAAVKEDGENTPESVNSGLQINLENHNKYTIEESNKDFEITNSDELKDNPINNAIDGLQNVVSKFNKIGQKDELNDKNIKLETNLDDKNKKDTKEDTILIDNNMNIQEPSEKLNVQTEANMNFNSSEQPFSQFVNAEQSNNTLKSTSKELAEEKAILSTMEENIAIARKNMLLQERAKENEKEKGVITKEKDILAKEIVHAEQEYTAEPKTETIQNDKGIKKVDRKTHIVVDTIVSYENVIMDKNDVDFFVNLVNNGVVNLDEIQNPEKSSRVSKTLADLIAKAMNENKPVRIDFDNNISVIIKIDRAGKISADFLPSSQIAEAYLKENLPLLKQKFDDNNIDYNELNQRKQKQDSQDNRKKGRKDE